VPHRIGEFLGGSSPQKKFIRFLCRIEQYCPEIIGEQRRILLRIAGEFQRIEENSPEKTWRIVIYYWAFHKKLGYIEYF